MMCSALYPQSLALSAAAPNSTSQKAQHLLGCVPATPRLLLGNATHDAVTCPPVLNLWELWFAFLPCTKGLA